MILLGTHLLPHGETDMAYHGSFPQTTILRRQSVSNVSVEGLCSECLMECFPEGVAEGRQIFVNLKRSIQYTISHSSPEVIAQLLCAPLPYRSPPVFSLIIHTDVVVPIPITLSAILILVIGMPFLYWACLIY